MENKYFNEVTNLLPKKIRHITNCLPDNIKQDTYEIRLRKNKPVVLYGKYGSLFIHSDTTYSNISWECAVGVTQAELDDTVAAICGYSVYAHQSEISNGYVTFGSGHRAGFSGTAVTENNKIVMLRNISSVNIRIANNNYCVPTEVKKILNDFQGIILSGPPCSGKTTLLKSIAFDLSSEYNNGFKKTVVIDERYELQNCNGINCDILSGYPKQTGIIHAIRTLSPNVIICDEVSTICEAQRIIEGLYSGVKFIVSLHCSSLSEMINRPVAKLLLDSGFFDYEIMLCSGSEPGKVAGIVKTEELRNEFDCINNHNSNIFFDSIYDNSQGKRALQNTGGLY